MITYQDLDLGKIHKTIEKATGLQIFASAQDVETAPLPFIMYNDLNEEKYKEYQRIRTITKTESGYSTSYEYPTKTDIQYSVHYTSKERKKAKQMIRQLYMFIGSEEFKQTLDGVGLTIMSAIRPSFVPKDQFFELQFMFDVRWLWRDGMTIDSGDTIDSADDPTKVTPPTGA